MVRLAQFRATFLGSSGERKKWNVAFTAYSCYEGCVSHVLACSSARAGCVRAKTYSYWLNTRKNRLRFLWGPANPAQLRDQCIFVGKKRQMAQHDALNPQLASLFWHSTTVMHPGSEIFVPSLFYTFSIYQPTILQFFSLKISRSTFLNFIRFVARRIFSRWNYVMFWQVLPSRKNWRPMWASCQK